MICLEIFVLLQGQLVWCYFVLTKAVPALLSKIIPVPLSVKWAQNTQLYA